LMCVGRFKSREYAYGVLPHGIRSLFHARYFLRISSLYMILAEPIPFKPRG